MHIDTDAFFASVERWINQDSEADSKPVIDSQKRTIINI